MLRVQGLRLIIGNSKISEISFVLNKSISENFLQTFDAQAYHVAIT